MKYTRVRNEKRGVDLARHAEVADSWWPRLRGLLGRPALTEGEGVLLLPCRSVHMFGMRFPIDVAFVGESGEVVALYPSLKPGGRTKWHRQARYALELPDGTLAATRTTVGDILAWEAATQEAAKSPRSIEQEVLS